MPLMGILRDQWRKRLSGDAAEDEDRDFRGSQRSRETDVDFFEDEASGRGILRRFLSGRKGGESEQRRRSSSADNYIEREAGFRDKPTLKQRLQLLTSLRKRGNFDENLADLFDDEESGVVTGGEAKGGRGKGDGMRFGRGERERGRGRGLNDYVREDVDKYDTDVAAEADDGEGIVKRAPCPSFEDFGAETGGLFAMDTIEGFRMVFSKSFWRNRLEACQVVNLGTYPNELSQASLLRALLVQSNSSGSKGGATWSSTLRYTNTAQNATFLTRYSESSKVTETRAILKLSDTLITRLSFITPSFKSYFATAAKIVVTGGRNAMETWRKDHAAGNHANVGIVAVEKTADNYNITLKASHQEAPVYSAAYSMRLFKNVFLGADWALLKSSGASVSSYGARYQNDDLICSGVVSVSPNFQKTMAEGMKEKVLNLRVGGASRVNERVTLAAEAELPLNPGSKAAAVERSMARLGYEYQFAQSRVTGSIDTALTLSQTIQDISGLQFSGELDFKNDSYKMGFGFELSPK